MKSCDPKQESKHTIHLDKNNLYGYVMFKCNVLDPNELYLNKYTSNIPKGCVLEVDF